MASPIAGLAVRPKHRLVVGLRGNNILLSARQQLLRFGQRQTQIAISPRPSGRLISITWKFRD
jgi:hypothetical protein